VNPRGETIAQASEDNDELLVSDLDMSVVDQVRSVWQFYRDRRPETYEQMTQQ
jgi:N-carbamoylputrescine amidase